MPRKLRYEVVGLPQHVVQRGNNRQACFYQEEDYRFYLECLGEASKKHACDIHAYVLMTNHVHILATPQEIGGIARMMQSIGRRYVYYINWLYRRTGTLWEGRYKASLIEGDQHLLVCTRYIENNPVRAGMVEKAEDYPWSSYRHHAMDLADSIVTDHPVFLSLGETKEERQREYKKLCNEAISDEVIEEIRNSIQSGLVMGRVKFQDEIEVMLKRRIRPGKKGRPIMRKMVSI
jgi:putative transposase